MGVISPDSLSGQLTVEAKAANQGHQFDLVRVSNGLAHLQTDQQGDLRAMLLDQVGEVLENLAARSWVQPRPGAMIESLTRRRYSGVCVSRLRPERA